MMKHAALLAGIALGALALPAHAQGIGHREGEDQAGGYHVPDDATIVITAPFRRDRRDLLAGVSVVTGSELVRETRPTIGETLTRQPGVSATSFGPNASRPVLRGFQGDRVRVLTDGIGSFDASSTSVDHAVVINPLTADRIEVLRGPSALLFGSSAIGGVVNVIDSRIPRRMPDEALHIDAQATYGSAADERAIGSAVDVPVGGKIVLHVDGSYTKTGDLDTGGFILSPTRRAEAAASADPEIRDLANLKGKLPNSAARTWDVAGGAAIVTDTGNLGFSVSRYDSLYGVPIRYALEPGEEAEAVRLDVRQTRADLRGEVETGDGFLERIRLRAGFADYRHDELEEDGAIGTTFLNKGIEGRVEFVQAKRGGWQGAFGGQLLTRDFQAIGEEKFVPKTESQQYGLFTLQQFDLGAVRAEAGGRFERSIISAAADEDLGNPDLRRSFNAFSGSLGASVAIAPAWRVGLNLSRTERAPSAEELYSNGPHAGTQAFEIGDPNLAKEKSWGVEATLRGSGPGYSLEASAYHSWFDDYIYDSLTGEIEDGLPVFAYSQADARYYGFEIEGSATLATLGETAIVVDGVADYVRAQIRGTGPAPRIPPLRLLGGIEAQANHVQGRVEVEHAFRQDRVSAFETETAGWTMVNASVSVSPFGRANPTRLILSANNIFDIVARRHASVLKDFAPLAGRDLRASVRFSF
ncbi:TonB-dependent receptor [Sphingomonas sp. 1P06PA]|uniref:TonB-dependent receptor n=1 Tax=Sphingomonas sp. 1P06PA TaxID=554121 RepID=UPI0039A4D020